MRFDRSPVFLCLTLAFCSAAQVLGAPGLPSEPAIGFDVGAAKSAVLHRAEAQSAASAALGPIAVSLDQVAAHDVSSLVAPHVVPRGVVSGPAASWMTGGNAALDLPAPRWPQGYEPQSEKALGDVFRSFVGLRSAGFSSDTDSVLAVGAAHVIQATKDGFAIYDKGGSVVRLRTLWRTFFRDLMPTFGPVLAEPRVVYSPEHDRYLMLVNGTAYGVQQRSYWFLAVSQTSDPRGEWWLYRFDGETPGNESRLGDVDLGVDTFGVYVTGNLYDWEESTFKWAVLWSLDTGVLNGGPARSSVQWDLRWPDASRAFGLRSARPHTVSSEGATFFVNTRPGSGNQIALWRLTGDRGGAPVLAVNAITTQPYQSIGSQVNQPGTEVDINGGDSQVQNAIYAFRRVYATWTTDPSSAGTSSGVHWLKLNTDARSVITEEILHGGEGWYYFNPAITILGGAGPLLNTGLFLNVVERGSVFLSAAGYISNVEGEDRFQILAQGDRAVTREEASYNGATYDFFRPGWMWGSVQYAGPPQIPLWTRILAVAMDDEATDDGDPSVCFPTLNAACLVGGRFRVEIEWRDFSGATGQGVVADEGTDNSALLWFFDPNNWEVLVKVLNGCGINQRYWVFAAGTTDVAYTLRVTDTTTGRVSTYSNPLGNASEAVTDSDAFATCP
ncbi:MAG: hypothetical protein AAF560_06795 [Acidobacteriota bacterium]